MTMNEQELQAAIDATPEVKVTKEYMESRILEIAYFTGNASAKTSTYIPALPPTVTMCSLTLDNGYSVRGEAACVHIDNYREDIGRDLAYKQAFAKLWPLFGFMLAEQLYLDNKVYLNSK